MKKYRDILKVTDLRQNNGQIQWLPKNPRQWTQTDIDKTAASIREDEDFLEDRPLLVVPDGDKWIVFAGNLRLTAARKVGLKEVPCVVYEVNDPDGDYTTIKRRAMKDNGSFGSWDFDMLANEWDDLPLQDWGVPSWEDNTTEEETTPAQPDTVQDDFDEETEKVETRCNPGDVWKLGNHRLMCGDSTKAADWEKLMEGREARLCVTSPPYGVGMEYEQKGIGPWRNTIFGVIEQITKYCRIVSWNIGDLFATGTQFIEPTSMYSTEKMKECGFSLMYARIWKKQGGNFAGTNPYYLVSMKPVQEYEWILGYGKTEYEKDYKPIQEEMLAEAQKADLNNDKLKEITGAGFMYGHWFTPHQWTMMDEENYLKIQTYCEKNGIDAFRTDYADIRRRFDDLNIYQKTLEESDRSSWGQWAIWDIPTVNRREGHPAAFPVELPSRCIKMHSREGDLVIEPFGGSGTTMIACEELNRVCRIMEIDPHYCDVILARWEKLTGKTAERAEN